MFRFYHQQVEFVFFFNMLFIPFKLGTTKDQIQREWNCFKADKLEGLPKPALLQDSERNYFPPDEDFVEQWIQVANMKSPLGNFLYTHLAKVMFGILTIPYSNAPCERVFSQVSFLC